MDKNIKNKGCAKCLMDDLAQDLVDGSRDPLHAAMVLLAAAGANKDASGETMSMSDMTVVYLMSVVRHALSGLVHFSRQCIKDEERYEQFAEEVSRNVAEHLDREVRRARADTKHESGTPTVH